SLSRSLWVNTNSLSVRGYSLTDKISAKIEIFTDGFDDIIKITNVSTTITSRDISIPLSDFVDTRIDPENVFIRQFTNYGVWIDGKTNPFAYAQLVINDRDRFEKR